MIIGFANKSTEDIYHGLNSREARKISMSLWPLICRKLDMLNAASQLLDLSSPPGNRLEKLKRKISGRFSIRVNGQYRITFLFEGGAASEVKVEDYH